MSLEEALERVESASITARKARIELNNAITEIVGAITTNLHSGDCFSISTETGQVSYEVVRAHWWGCQGDADSGWPIRRSPDHVDLLLREGRALTSTGRSRWFDGHNMQAPVWQTDDYGQSCCWVTFHDDMIPMAKWDHRIRFAQELAALLEEIERFYAVRSDESAAAAATIRAHLKGE